VTAPLRWAIAGGGSGGHVTPALALGQTARAAGEACLFLGARRGMETRLVPEAGFELVALPAQPVVGRGPLARAGAFAALAASTALAGAALLRFAPDAVISVGGYAAMPACLAAVLLRRPLALVETNARPGTANRAVARFARRIFVEFEAAGAALAGAASDPRVRVLGLPLRRELVEAFRGAPQARAPEPPYRLFVCGGSQGARQINDALVAAIPALDPARVAVVHQTGESDRARVEEAWRKAGFEALVTAFERDMPSRYRWADLVVCRAGAISVAELALAGRAALLVPLAHVGGGEQFANARELERAGAARVLDSRQLSQEAFTRELVALLEDPAQLRAMGARAAGLGRPEAAQAIAAECRRLAEARA
jgi:UDP-N-acetylglucosamine--N-acetylmuramyl-(pentapeptide) pyrophosphoryl-undecaprenol N-acetylglucosamine transferase